MSTLQRSLLLQLSLGEFCDESIMKTECEVHVRCSHAGQDVYNKPAMWGCCAALKAQGWGASRSSTEADSNTLRAVYASKG